MTAEELKTIAESAIATGVTTPDASAVFTETVSPAVDEFSAVVPAAAEADSAYDLQPESGTSSPVSVSGEVDGGPVHSVKGFRFDGFCITVAGLLREWKRKIEVWLTRWRHWILPPVTPVRLQTLRL